MKIRINGNRLRLRLSKSEVAKVVKDGEVSDQCLIFGTTLTYRLISHRESVMYARFVHNTITVYAPEHFFEEWDTDDRVGFDGYDTNGLYILVEKDFQCLSSHRDEDESDLYPNPDDKGSEHL